MAHSLSLCTHKNSVIPTLHSQELSDSDVDKLSNNGYEEDFGKREKLKELQMEFIVVRFGLSALGWYEPYQSSVSFGHVEFVVMDIQGWVNDMHSNVGGLKSTILTSFDQIQTTSDVFRSKMAKLEASVVVANMNREAKYKQILSLVVRSDVRYSRPDTILKKKFGFYD
nr:uncharacterized protein LOC112038245 [Quercus suber]POE92614.1 hypothetical protein CFP56_62609 [Quercus suber]